MVGVAGGGVRSASGPIQKVGYGPILRAGGGRGGGAVGFWPDTKGKGCGGGGGGEYDHVSGGPGYSTVFRVRISNRAAIL